MRSLRGSMLAVCAVLLLLSGAANAQGGGGGGGGRGGAAAKPSPSGLDVRVPNALDIVSDGIPNALVRSADSVSALPVPASVAQVKVEWEAKAGTSYAITTWSADPGVATLKAVGVETAGVVPTSPSPFQLAFECHADGTTTLNMTITVWGGSAALNTSFYDNATFYVAKECGDASASCAACGTCYRDGKCSCVRGARGTICHQAPTPLEMGSGVESGFVAPDDGAAIRVVSWNIWGVGTTETQGQLTERTREIGRLLAGTDAAEGNFDVLALQELWNDPARDALVDEVKDRFPYMVRQGFGNGPSRQSGLFIGSRFPIEAAGFEEFSSSVVGSSDSLSDKGIMGALLRVGSDSFLYVFVTHMQAGGSGREGARVRSSQLRQIRTFIQSSVSEALNAGRAASDMSVLLVGDMNIGSSTIAINGSTTYADMMDGIGYSNLLEEEAAAAKAADDAAGGARAPTVEESTEELGVFEMYYAAHPDGMLPARADNANFEAQLAALGLNASDFEGLGGDGGGASALAPGAYGNVGNAPGSRRVDYGFAYSRVGSQSVRTPEVIAATVMSPVAAGRTGTVGGADAPAAGTPLSDHRAFIFTVSVASSDVVGIAVGVTFAVLAAGAIAWVAFRVFVQHKAPLPTPPVGAAVYVRQTRILMRKNYLLNVRNRRALLIQLSVPGFFVLLLWVMQFALQANENRLERQGLLRMDDPEEVPTVPRCHLSRRSGLDYCYTLAYAPDNNPVLDSVIDRLRAANGIPKAEVRAFASVAAAEDWMGAHLNSTMSLLDVGLTMDGNAIAAANYTIGYNETSLGGFARGGGGRIRPLRDIVFPLQHHLDAAIIAEAAARAAPSGGAAPYGVTINTRTVKFPHPQLRPIDVIGSQGPTFFIGAMLFPFVIQLGMLVNEKETDLRQALSVHGMRNSVYWFTWLTANSVVNVCTSLLLVIFGAIFGFDFFLKNDFMAYFALLAAFSIAMVPVGFALGVFVKQSRTATSVGFAVYLLSIILQALSGVMFTEDVDEEWRIIFALLPVSLLAHGVRALSSASVGDDVQGLRWADRGVNDPFWPLQSTLNWLVADFFIWLVAAMLLDFLLEDTVAGESRLARLAVRLFAKKAALGEGDAATPSAAPAPAPARPAGVAAPGGEAGIEMTSNGTRASGAKQVRSRGHGHVEDEDVKAETELVRGLGDGSDFVHRDEDTAERSGIVLQGLRKVFVSTKCGCVPNSDSAFTAVRPLWLRMQPNSLFALLGHNGAGKTTTLSMINGILPPTDGDVRLCGHSVRNEINKVHPLIGVCPQHDRLWAELSAREHIELFAGLKSVRQEAVDEEVRERLEDVELSHAADRFAGTYSGGMRRRLSLAIAFTGSPRIVFLDEPTTGMDPVSRRQVWNLLEREKHKRAIVLTSHSMEEVDTLGDQVAIMRAGSIRCIGPTVRLKRKFGAGYRITIVCGHGGSGSGGGGGGGTSEDADTASVSTGGGTTGGPIGIAAAAEAKDEEGRATSASSPASHGGGGPGDTAEAEALVARVAPHSRLVRRGLGVLEYVLPTRPAGGDGSDGSDAGGEEASSGQSRASPVAGGDLAGVLEALFEGSAAAGIKDVQVGLTSMEDVFLAVTGAGRVDAHGNEIDSDAEEDEGDAAGAGAAQGAGATASAGAAAAAAVPTTKAPTASTMAGTFAVGRPVHFSMRRQFEALVRKSALLERRRWRTNLAIVLMPLVLVALLQILQTLAEGFIRARAGDTVAGVPHPPAIPFPFFVPASGSFDPRRDCPRSMSAPLSDGINGEMLYTVDPAADARSSADAIDATLGAYGAPVPADANQFWTSVTGSLVGGDGDGEGGGGAAVASGLLGNATRQLQDMLAVQGRGGSASSFCLNQPFIMPLQFKQVAGGRKAVDDELFANFAKRGRASSYVFRDASATPASAAGAATSVDVRLAYDVYWNETSARGEDLARVNNVVTNAAFRWLSAMFAGAFPATAPPVSDSTGLQMLGVRPLPIPDQPVSFDLISLAGPNFWVFVYQLIFPIAIGTLVYERQYQLREIMKMMGLRSSVYFASSWVTFFAMYAVSVLSFELLAVALGFRFFTENDFGLILLLNLLWGHTCLASAFVVSTLFQSSRTATVAAYCYVFASGILAVALIASYFTDEETAPETVALVQLVPTFALHRAILTLRDGVTGDATGLTWADLSKPEGEALAEVYWVLFVEFIVLVLLGLYMEAVWPSAVGVKRHPCFCLQRSFWRTVSQRRRAARGAGSGGPGATALRAWGDTGGEDGRERVHDPPKDAAAVAAACAALSAARKEPADVAGERLGVFNDHARADDAVRVLNLQKTFAASGSGNGVAAVKAVDQLTLGIRRGDIFGLLGPNGSGKTTTINCINGLLTPSSGTATVLGLDIHDDMDLIHLAMGVCPQSNVLWPALSLREHLQFFGRLKGLEGAELDTEVDRRVRDVGLQAAADKPTGQLSGGMQRRACVAISLVGSPAVILLDEPTTGLDPAARRSLWRVIDAAREHAAILMTSHSLEEAEALCSRVGVFVRGTLRAVGSPAELKRSVGNTFKCTLVVDTRAALARAAAADGAASATDSSSAAEVRKRLTASVHRFMQAQCPPAELISPPLASTYQYSLPKTAVQLPALVKALQAKSATVAPAGAGGAGGGAGDVDDEEVAFQLTDWGVRNVTLEEVFLAIAEQDPAIGARLRRERAANAGMADKAVISGGKAGLEVAPAATAVSVPPPEPRQVSPEGVAVEDDRA